VRLALLLFVVRKIRSALGCNIAANICYPKSIV
jgi:hypothetical protein